MINITIIINKKIVSFYLKFNQWTHYLPLPQTLNTVPLKPVLIWQGGSAALETNAPISSQPV